MEEQAGTPMLGFAIDDLPINLAIVDREGVIVQRNESWATFGRDNEAEGPRIDRRQLPVCL